MLHFYYFCTVKSLKSIYCILALLLFLQTSLVASGSGISFSFNCGSTRVNEKVRSNERSIEELDNSLSQGQVLRVTLRSFSSPDGSAAANRRISASRASSVKDFILEREANLDESAIRIISEGEDWKGVEKVLRSSDYAWKDEALEIIRSGGENRKQLLQELYVGEAWEVLMKKVFPKLRRVEVSFIYALSEGEHSFELAFPSGIGWVSENYRSNSKVLDSVRSLVASSPDTIYVRSYASIDGSSSANAKLSAKRARSIRSFIIAEGYDPSKIVVEEVGEDWDGLANFVRNSNLDGKDEILEVLEDSSTSIAQKKTKLRSLDKGRCWKQLCSAPMASLRRVVVE